MKQPPTPQSEEEESSGISREPKYEDKKVKQKKKLTKNARTSIREGYVSSSQQKTKPNFMKDSSNCKKSRNHRFRSESFSSLGGHKTTEEEKKMLRRLAELDRSRSH